MTNKNIELKPLTPFVKIKGNINGAVMQILKIENNSIVVLKDCKSGNIFHYGFDALKRCDITIIF